MGECLNGRVTWDRQPAHVQAAIGAAAIELVCCWVGLDAEPAHPATERTRRFEQAESDLCDRLMQAVLDNVPTIDVDEVPLPSVCFENGHLPAAT